MNHINRFLSDDDRNDLMKEITEEEVRSVLLSCNKKKSPGPDGLTYEVYLNNFDSCKNDF